MSAATEAPSTTEQGRRASSERGPTPGQVRRRKGRRRTAVVVGVAVALLAAMLISTRYYTPAQVEAFNPPAFEASAYVEERFPEIAANLADEATPIATLAPAVDADPTAAGQEYGVDQGSGAFAFPVSAEGTVASVDESFAVIVVDGVPEGDTVRVPLGSALNGTPVRDADGLRFGDFPGQTDYQNVANELKLTMQEEVLAPVGLAGQQGQQVSVVGVYASGGPPNSFIIQPVSIEVAS